VRKLLLGVIALLYVASIPWYRETGAPTPLWLGLPDWVTVAVLCYVAVAVLNALAWLGTDIPDAVDDRAAGSEGGAPGPDDPGGAG